MSSTKASTSTSRTPRTEWGKKLLGASWWNEGMRGHFTRLPSGANSPDFMAYAITAIEEEAIELVNTVAERLVNTNPWVHDGGDDGDIYCWYCNREYDALLGRLQDPDRRQHEPECPWIELRDVLGRKTGGA